MSQSKKQGFSAVREFCLGVADDLTQSDQQIKCDVKITRSQRCGANYFEVIPEGSSYGPRLRFTDEQLCDPFTIDKVLSKRDDMVGEAKEVMRKLAELNKELESE